MLGSSLQHISVELLLPVPQEFPYHLPAQAFPLQDEVSHPHRSVWQETSLNQILDTLLWLPAKREEVGQIAVPLELRLVPFLELTKASESRGSIMWSNSSQVQIKTSQHKSKLLSISQSFKIPRYPSILIPLSSFIGGIPQVEEMRAYFGQDHPSNCQTVLRKGLSSRPRLLLRTLTQDREEVTRLLCSISYILPSLWGFFYRWGASNVYRDWDQNIWVGIIPRAEPECLRTPMKPKFGRLDFDVPGVSEQSLSAWLWTASFISPGLTSLSLK